ncbi:hypothetical protein BFW01_g6975 [Lasiodiplodia theobromae]|uniref:uncharacterized protein n=1 Tax=Lasiodiplodia theobromae TaxID=45133 RepID=UPI0015C3F6B1|nr:uncharacterized protein LTHEOB_4787 [Lasiodiplodia theobromae]KAF4545528.1 hypothetical protein LTHEOB_4787 [Lasiodiplodia theobromae]KAF9636080.1 hypothetical protein BFW01_g6975 [Lasiodiplodia theobromae]
MAPQPRPITCIIIAAILLTLPAAVAAQAACYYPNGTDRNAQESSKPYRPCTVSSPSSSTGEETAASMCCRTRDWDDCRADGLCQVGNITWRESCTDRTWKAKECLQLCVVDDSFAADDVRVVQCADKSWCCDYDGTGRNAADCCNRGQGKWINAERQVVTTRPTSLAAASTVVVAESKGLCHSISLGFFE